MPKSHEATHPRPKNKNDDTDTPMSYMHKIGQHSRPGPLAINYSPTEPIAMDYLEQLQTTTPSTLKL